MMPAERQLQRRPRTMYTDEYKLRVVHEALARPEACRIKPTCRDHPGVEPVRLARPTCRAQPRRRRGEHDECAIGPVSDEASPAETLGDEPASSEQDAVWRDRRGRGICCVGSLAQRIRSRRQDSRQMSSAPSKPHRKRRGMDLILDARV